jgi:hypothetical protein
LQLELLRNSGYIKTAGLYPHLVVVKAGVVEEGPREIATVDLHPHLVAVEAGVVVEDPGALTTAGLTSLYSHLVAVEA